jgi:hypothetical protein
VEFGDEGDADHTPVDDEESETEGDAHDKWEPPLFVSPHDTHEEDNKYPHDGTQDPHTLDAQAYTRLVLPYFPICLCINIPLVLHALFDLSRTPTHLLTSVETRS